MKRRLAVILVADMVDYSRAMQEDEARALAHVQALRTRWLDPEITARGGHVLKRTGDGLIAEFSTTGAAVETAMAVQKALAGNEDITLRLAAHLGEIAEDGDDIYGTAINIAARLQIEAPPGGVMVSGDLQRQLDLRLAGRFSDAGEFQLKNIAQPVTGFQWRPDPAAAEVRDDVPVLAVTPIAVSGETSEGTEAAADLQAHLVARLSRRTGVRIVEMEETGAPEVSPTYFLRGRLRWRPPNVRLVMNLTLSDGGRTIWSEVFERETEDLFDFCDEAVHQADNDLRVAINTLDGERLAAIPEDRLSPAELRSRAAQFFYRTTVAYYEEAHGLLERARVLNPAHAMTHAMLSEARTYLHEARFTPPDAVAIAEIAALADWAVKAAPRSDYAFYVRADVRARLFGDGQGALRDADRIERINPGYNLMHEVRGYARLVLGEYDAAASAFAIAVRRSERDSFLPYRAYCLTVALIAAGRPDEAATALADALELRPDCRAYRLLEAEICAARGENERAGELRALADEMDSAPDILVQRLPLKGEAARLMDLISPVPT